MLNLMLIGQVTDVQLQAMLLFIWWSDYVEFVPLSVATQEAVWIRRLLTDLGCTDERARIFRQRTVHHKKKC